MKRTTPQSTSVPTEALAGYLHRFLAFLIDTFIVTLMFDLIAPAFAPYAVKLSLEPNQVSTNVLVSLVKDSSSVVFVYLVLFLAYYLLFEGLFGTTPGKRFWQLRVVGDNGMRPSFRAVLIRNLLRIVEASGQDLWLAALFLLVTKHKQRLGDLAAHTYVVNRHYLAPDALGQTQRRLRSTLAIAALVVIYPLTSLGANLYPAGISTSAAANTPFVNISTNGFNASFNLQGVIPQPITTFVSTAEGLAVPPAANKIGSWSFEGSALMNTDLTYKMRYDVANSSHSKTLWNSCTAIIHLSWDSNILAYNRWSLKSIASSCGGQTLFNKAL